MATAQTTKDVVQQTFDALNDRDRDAFIDLHVDDAVAHVDDETFHDSEEIVTDQFAHFDAFLVRSGNSAVAGHCDLICQGRVPHVYR